MCNACAHICARSRRSERAWTRTWIPSRTWSHYAPAQLLFFDWGKKKPRSMAGLRVCIM